VAREFIVRRRRIGPEDLKQIRRLIVEEGQQGRSHISERLCEIWNWRQANGRFRQIACRDLLRRLQSKSLIELPPMLKPARRAGYVNRLPRPELLDRTVSGKLLPRLECQAVTVPSLGRGCVEAMVMGRSSPLPERGIFHQKAERLLKKVFPTIY
jgi:hypothetical protein